MEFDMGSNLVRRVKYVTYSSYIVEEEGNMGGEEITVFYLKREILNYRLAMVRVFWVL